MYVGQYIYPIIQAIGKVNSTEDKGLPLLSYKMSYILDLQFPNNFVKTTTEICMFKVLLR